MPMTSCKYIRKDKFINTIKNRFYQYVCIPQDENGCMEWSGSKSLRGRGSLNINKKYYMAHRLSYLIYFGEIPKNMHVLHKCDNPSCVRPDHLFLGSHLDNMNDRKSKNRDPMKKGEIYKFSYQKLTGRSGNRKLTDCQVKMIKNLLILKNLSQSKISKMFNTHLSTISNINTGKLYGDILCD